MTQTITSVRLPVELNEQLERVAKQIHRNKSFVIRELIETYLEDLKDAYDADSIMKRIASGETKTVAWEEIRDELED